MMRMLRFAVPLLPLLGACSAEEPVLNFTDYRAAFNQAITDYFKRCGVVDGSRAALVATTPLLAVAPELQQTIDSEVRIGRVRLSTACFASLKDAACDISEAYAAIQSCTIDGKQYLPQVPLGRLCRLQGECIGGYCDLGAVRRPCGTGVCTAYLRVGTQCGAGLGRCDPEQATCWEGTCRARGGASAACLSDADCDGKHTCRDQGGARACVPRQANLGVGSTCDAGQIPDGCGVGGRCVAAEPGQEPTCVRGKSDGSACYSTLECQGTSVCVGADVAARRPGNCQRQGQPGDPCAAAGSICQLTLYCEPQTKTCQPAAANGQPCARDPIAPGQACLSGQCVAQGGASEGVCTDRAPDGSPCKSPADCLSGVCGAGGTCSSVCAPLR